MAAYFVRLAATPPGWRSSSAGMRRLLRRRAALVDVGDDFFHGEVVDGDVGDFGLEELAFEGGDGLVQDEGAVVDHDDALADLLDVVGVVGGEEDGDTFLGV